MKTFLTTLKGKIIAGVATIVVAGAVVAAVIISNSGFRTIVVNAFNGVTTIVNGTKSSEAYEGLHLKAGDDVTVSSDADLTLAMDEDKYVYAEANTHFWVEAKGKLDNTKTKVYMDEGSNLFRIDDKLEGEEYFEVDTPNSTMSVRGTVFRVTCYTDANGEFYTDVQVYEGEVFVQAKFKDGKNADDNRVFTAGECVTIHLDKENTISEFVKSDSDYVMTDADYAKLTPGAIDFLALAEAEGRKLCIDVNLIGEHNDDAEEEETLQEAQTTDEAVAEKTEPEQIEETADEEAEDIVVQEEQETEVACEHTYGEAVVVKEATYYEEGVTVSICLKCGATVTGTIPKKDMSYEMMEQIAQETWEREVANCDHEMQSVSKSAADCESAGKEVYVCTKCGYKTTRSIGSHGHSWELVAQAGAPSGSYVCKICGARK